jgi:hypothetical protein
VSSNTPTPTTQSPAFRLIAGGALLVGLTVFIVALHRPHRSELASIKENTDGWWMHQTMATPRPTPRAMPTPQPHPVLVVQPPPHIAPQPTPKPVSELWLRYRRAIETGMGGDTNSVRELPRVIQAGGQPAPSPTPNIFSLGAYPQP